MPQNYGLGRGLASLIPKKNNSGQNAPAGATIQSMLSKNNQQVREVEIEKIVPNPHQPRLGMDEEKLKELSDSILNHGIIQPLIVSAKGDQYEIIAGERRLEAAKKAGLKKVPVIVREVEEKEKLELAIVENIQRHDLDPLEEAKAFKKLIDEFQMSQDEVAQKVSKSRSAVANKIRLLNLPIDIQRALSEGKITEGHAKAILAVENSEKQRALFELIIKNNLTVRQVEDKTKEISVRSHKRTVHFDPQIKEIEEKLMGTLGTKVKLVRSREGGKIVIEYYSEEELKNILSKISPVTPGPTNPATP